MFHRYVELPEGKMQSEPAVMKSRTFRQWLEMAGTSPITWIPKLGMKRNMLWPTCQLLHAKNPRHWETSPDVADLKSALLWMMYDDVRKCLVLRQTTERPQNFVMLLMLCFHHIIPMTYGRLSKICQMSSSNSLEELWHHKLGARTFFLGRDCCVYVDFFIECLPQSLKFTAHNRPFLLMGVPIVGSMISIENPEKHNNGE